MTRGGRIMLTETRYDCMAIELLRLIGDDHNISRLVPEGYE